MLQCSSKATILRLFYNTSSSFLLLFIFFHFTSIFLAKLFIFLGGSPFYERNQDGYEFTSDEEEIEEEQEQDEQQEFYRAMSMEEDSNFVGGIVFEDETTSLGADSDEPLNDELSEESFDNDSEETVYSTPATESSDEEILEEGILTTDTDADSEANEDDPTSNFGINQKSTILEANNHEIIQDKEEKPVLDQNGPKREIRFREEDSFLDFRIKKAEGKKLVQEKGEHEIFEDTFTLGSTSKDSSEWRSSINGGTDDPFSSSSRRSCPNWESYTVFQKYDEEMLFLDRISAQKLHETESLRSIQACPRSISERIVLKLRSNSKKSSEFRRNPYHELESNYVAQICLTWEALNWNYKHFQRLRASRREFDPGCPAYTAQQFQQFQVLLQRYIENEPYEHGRRPEIYARMRSLAPKLLQVPEYIDSNDDSTEENSGSRIPSNSFLIIMEESIATFANFLKQDKKTHCQILAALFKRNRKGSANGTLLFLLKKVNKKKKAELDKIRRSGNCLRKRKLRKDEELEILMALIDLKLVSRVLRMQDLNGEQLHWCENKMSKVRVSDGRLQRDSTPLFFTAN